MEATPCHATDDQGRKSVVTITKKRFALLENKLKDLIAQKGLDEHLISDLCAAICEALAFNPKLPAYTKEVLQRRKQEFKNKLLEKNMNTYDAHGRAYYETHREQCIAKASEYQAKRKIHGPTAVAI